MAVRSASTGSIGGQVGHNWFPDTEYWWIIVVGAFILILDIMEHCDVDTLKESCKSIWANVAVTAALVLTILCTMMQVDQGSIHYLHDEETREKQILLRQAYVAVLTIAVLFVFMSLFLCVIHLIYVEPLDNVDVAKFMVANPSSLGDVTVSLMIAIVHLGMAFMIWVLGTYGVPNFIVSVLCGGLCFTLSGYQLWDKATFDPTEKTRRAEDWRYVILDPASWPKKAFGHDAKTVATIRRFGALIEESLQTKRSATEV